MTLVEKALHGIDTAHRRHTWIAFPYAVAKKFNEDQAGNLAALIAYYGFFSLFPLLLVLVTVLDTVLPSNGNLRQSIFNSALSNFPLIGPQISKNVHSLRGGSGLTLAIGIALTFWAGLGAALPSEMMDTILRDSCWDEVLGSMPEATLAIRRSSFHLGGCVTLDLEGSSPAR